MAKPGTAAEHDSVRERLRVVESEGRQIAEKALRLLRAAQEKVKSLELKVERLQHQVEAVRKLINQHKKDAHE